jgi:FAD synthase
MIGIQNLVIHPFDEAFSKLTAEDFVQTVLVNQFDIIKSSLVMITDLGEIEQQILMI